MKKAQVKTRPQSEPLDNGMPPRRTIILLFIGLMTAMLMFSLNQTILSTALPTIVGELNGVDQMLWVSTAFMLASTIMMPIYGKLGDLVGRKYLFIAAISLFMAGSVFGIIAQDMPVLIVGRVIQGIGGGGMMILAQAIIADVVPVRERGKYMGIMGSVFAVSSVAGPLLGGWFTEGPGWRWTFWINIPLGLLALAAAIILIPSVKRTVGARPKLDVPGMILIVVFTTCLTLVSVWGGNEYAWISPQILGMSAVVVISAVTFVFVENRAAEPLIPMSLFKDRNFVLCTVAGLMVGVSMFGVLGYMPTYLQMALSIDAAAAGLHMIPMMAVMLISSTLVGFAVSKTGRYKLYPIVGVAVLAVSLFLLSTIGVSTPAWVISAYLGVMGLGLGLSMQILVLIVQNSFPVSMVGTATASNNFFRQIGSTLGMAIVGALFTSRLMNNLATSIPKGADIGADTGSLTPQMAAALPPEIHSIVVSAYNDALAPLFLYLVPLALAGLVALFWIKEKELATTNASPAGREVLEINPDADAGVTAVADAGEIAAEGDTTGSSDQDTAGSKQNGR